MKKFTVDEITEILRKHMLWRVNKEGGVRADLSGANLRDANMYEAELRDANLCKADLAGAILVSADLYGANMHNADLRGVDLRKADLRLADLRGAGLRFADLRGAVLAGANLSGAIIQNTQSDDLITACGLGPEGRQVIWDMKNDVVFCGCFCGSMAEAETRAREEYAESPRDLAEAMAMIAYFKAVAKVRRREEVNEAV
jgi:uncharacterized protein YjbI with pentapeptide repeats